MLGLLTAVPLYRCAPRPVTDAAVRQLQAESDRDAARQRAAEVTDLHTAATARITGLQQEAADRQHELTDLRHQFQTQQERARTAEHEGDQAPATARAWARLKALVSPSDKPHHAPGVDMATWPLPPGRSCVRRARRLTRAQLTDWHVNRHSKSADLLVRALVAKAFHRGRGPIRLTLWTMDGTLRCEVEDADPALPHTRHTGQDDEQGHWLGLIDQFACCWGATPTAAGKAGWFELSESPDMPSRPRAS